VPEPITGPGEAGAETHTAQDCDRPGGGRDQLSYPETKQVGRSTQRDPHTGPARQVSSLCRAAAACNVTPIVVRRWIARGWLPQPPWTLRQIHEVRDLNDAGRRLRGPGAAHGTETRWTQGCNCDLCCKAKTDAVRAGDRRRAHKRLPPEVRQQLLDAIYAGRPFRATVIDLGLTSNQVWGVTKPTSTGRPR
jgi:hypothetical protein